MKLVWLLLSFSLTEAALTRIYFKNGCDYDLNLFVTEDFTPPTLLETIPQNQIRLRAFHTGNMNFHVGVEGKTRVEFWFDKNEMDYYDINVVTGFDVPLLIQPKGGACIRCTCRNCPDGIVFPHEMPKRMHSMPTNGSFTLTFCPQDPFNLCSKK